MATLSEGAHRYCVVRLRTGADPAKLVTRRNRGLEYRILDPRTVLIGGQEPHRSRAWGEVMQAADAGGMLGEGKTAEEAIAASGQTWGAAPDAAEYMEVNEMSDSNGAMHSPTTSKIAKALAAAQGEMSHPKKENMNPHLKSKYADLASNIDAAKPALVKAGIAVSQIPSMVDGVMIITTMLLHDTEWIKGVYPVLPVQNTPQGYGSAITYARRYSLSAMLMLASEEDDDGAQAQAQDKKSAQATKPASPATAPAKAAVTPEQRARNDRLKALWQRSIDLGISESDRYEILQRTWDLKKFSQINEKQEAAWAEMLNEVEAGTQKMETLLAALRGEDGKVPAEEITF